ncbi:MAG: cyanophycinase [Vicinamibacterales bacterium]
MRQLMRWGAAAGLVLGAGLTAGWGLALAMAPRVALAQPATATPGPLVAQRATATPGPLVAQRATATPGPLVVVGGGGTTDEIVARALAIAGGPEAVVAVLPQASALATAGDSSVEMWRKAGAREAVKVTFDDRAVARAMLGRATLIWMPGGDQNRFMQAVAGTGLDDLIRERHRAGAVVGGTSAGAAVLSASMITGDADLQSLTTGTTVLAPGLGLWPGVIVDQHFLKRQRSNRLISAVLDHPALVGVGIDESTAVIVQGTTLEVVGRSAVIVVDARRATRADAIAGQPVAATGVTMAVLRAGMTFDLGVMEARR